MAQTTCATMFVWAVLTFLEQMAESRKKEEHLAPLDLSPSPQVKSLRRSLGLKRPNGGTPHGVCEASIGQTDSE